MNLVRPAPQADGTRFAASVGARLSSRSVILNTMAFTGLLLLLAVVGLHHEPWFDEAQAWLIARDNTLLGLVTAGVRYEGTPALWHLVLWGAQRSGLPYAGLWLVSCALAAGGAFIVLFKSPFPFWIRLGVVFSYFFAYQYSVVARSYALDLLFMPLLAWLFADRRARPLAYCAVLALIANTNAHSFVLSNVLILELAWSARRRVLADRRLVVALGLYGAAALAAALQAFPPPDINFLIRKPGDQPVLKALQLATEAFIERGDIFSASPPSLFWRAAGAVISLAVLAPSMALFWAARRLLLALALFGVLLGFSAVKYGNNWHAGIIFLAYLFSLWISWEARGRLSSWGNRWLLGGLGVLLSVQVWCTAAASWRDVQDDYSPAGAVAEALAAGLKAQPNQTIGVEGFKAFAVQPYFKKNLFANYDGGAPRPAYYLWRKNETPIPGVNEKTWLATASAGYDRLLLSTFNMMGRNGPFRFTRDARKEGYCPTAWFKAALIWKTYALESDNMMIFDRCPKGRRP